MEDISISLVKIIVFDFIIKQRASSTSFGVHSHSAFDSLVKSWLSRYEFAQQEKRLIASLSSGTSLFPTRPHPHYRTTGSCKDIWISLAPELLNISSTMAQAALCWKDSQVCESFRRQNSKTAPKIPAPCYRYLT